MPLTPERRIANLQCAIVLLLWGLIIVGGFFFYQLNKLNREVGEVKAWIEIQKQSKQSKGD